MFRQVDGGLDFVPLGVETCRMILFHALLRPFALYRRPPFTCLLLSGPGEKQKLIPNMEGNPKVMNHDDDSLIPMMKKLLDVQQILTEHVVQNQHVASECPFYTLGAGEANYSASWRVCRSWNPGDAPKAG